MLTPKIEAVSYFAEVFQISNKVSFGIDDFIDSLLPFLLRVGQARCDIG